MALTAIIDAQGISAPDYPTILAAFQDAYRGIYGQDVYLEPDSQDGQFLALLALVVNDANSMAIAVYNAFSPATAQGEGLSSVVKINGLTREVPSYSTATLSLGGTAGTVLQDPVAIDQASNLWQMSGQITIPFAGTIDAGAVCLTKGAVTAASGTITIIGTPSRGWQSVTNAAAAVPGQPVETDAALRQRQGLSTALPSRTILEGITGALLALPNVTRVRGYENATNLTDALGIAAYTIAFVVEGGVDTDIANTIAARKTPGVATQGPVSVSVINVYGLAQTIKFYHASPYTMYVTVNLKALTGYTSAMGQAIIDAIVAYANVLPIGAPLRISRMMGIADGIDPDAYYISSITYGATPPGTGTTDLPLLFNQTISLAAANVTLSVT